MKAQYDKQYAGKQGPKEVHARHILVPTEAQAKDIIAKLKGGADFATLAKQQSKDTGSQASGGDLGWFKEGDMVPAFSNAAFALKPGEVSPTPVHTEFGWHVIQTLGDRRTPPPTLDSVKQQIEHSLISKGVAQAITKAKADVKIETFNADGSPHRATDTATPPPAAVSALPNPQAAPWIWGLRPQRGRGQRPSPCLPDPPMRSPLAVDLPALPPIAGVRLGAAAAGIRYQGRPDLVMAELPARSTVAGVFTRSRCPGAPVDWCRAALPGGRARALVVNAGNANVFTGRAGAEAARATAAEAARLVGCRPREVFLASTGVIGEVLPHARLTAALPALHASLGRRRMGGGGARHHDHRHLPQGRDPHRADRRRRRCASAASPRAAA